MRLLALLMILFMGTGYATSTETLSKLVLNAVSGAPTSRYISAALDEQDRQVMERSSPRTVDRMDRSEPLTMNDVIKLSQGGVADDAIIRYMKESRSSYTLSQAQVRRLQDGGVSERVIKFMVDSGR
jgi:hypothetical protein